MNTTDGNRGIVPTQPTKGTSIRRPNTTDGNRWIFKILPTVGCQQVGLEHPPTSVGGIWLGWASLCRSDFNNPPTAVVGIQLSILKIRSEEHTSELQSLAYLVCRLLLEKKKTTHI